MSRNGMVLCCEVMLCHVMVTFRNVLYCLVMSRGGMVLLCGVMVMSSEVMGVMVMCGPVM